MRNASSARVRTLRPGLARHHEQRSAVAAADIEPRRRIDRALSGIGGTGREIVGLPAPAVVQVRADDVEIERPPHDDGAVAPEHGDGVFRVQVQPLEQFVEIAEADRAGDDAEEAAVGIADAAAQHDGIGAAEQHRAADEEPGSGIVAVDREIVLLAPVLDEGIERGSVDDQPALGIEHLDGAEMPGRRRVVEQDQVADRLGDRREFGQQHVAGDRLQRQVVDLDVAADVGLDGGCEVLQRLAGERLLAAAHVQHDVDADGREADHRHHGRDDQQLRRNPPWPPGRDFAPSKGHRSLPIPVDAPESLRSV